jgi:hypothetical protein
VLRKWGCRIQVSTRFHRKSRTWRKLAKDMKSNSFIHTLLGFPKIRRTESKSPLTMLTSGLSERRYSSTSRETKLPVQRMCWIFPGTSRVRKRAASSGERCGMWKSPMARTSYKRRTQDHNSREGKHHMRLQIGNRKSATFCLLGRRNLPCANLYLPSPSSYESDPTGSEGFRKPGARK